MKFHLQSCRVSPKSDTSCFIERSVSIMQLQQWTLMLQNSWVFGHCCMTVAWQTADGRHSFATKISRDVISAFSIIKCRSKKPLFSAASKGFSYRLGTILAKWSKEFYLRCFELAYFSNRFSFSLMIFISPRSPRRFNMLQIIHLEWKTTWTLSSLW